MEHDSSNDASPRGPYGNKIPPKDGSGAPSRSWHLNEMRKFASGLPEDFGPMFGRDVCRLLDVLESAGVVLDDPRLSYTEIQVDREAWEALGV